MELQTLASILKFCIDKIYAYQQRLAVASSPLYAEDLVLLSVLLTSAANYKSLGLGAIGGALGLLLLIWIDFFGPTPSLHSIIGPYRFVRYPRCLSLWLSTVGFCLAGRSFPALLLSLALLPWFYLKDMRRDQLQPRRRDLASIRYRLFVPALAPNFLPYKTNQEASIETWGWRQLWQGFRYNSQSQLGRLAIGWSALIANVLGYLPTKFLWILALIWLVVIGFRLLWPRFQRFIRIS